MACQLSKTDRFSKSNMALMEKLSVTKLAWLRKHSHRRKELITTKLSHLWSGLKPFDIYSQLLQQTNGLYNKWM